jgi:prepilin-type N-terminal cleavage/methylation domain-containing protein
MRHPRAESGYTLVEVLVVMLLLGLVLTPVVNALVFEGKQATVSVQYATAISDETTGLQHMMQEVRQAYWIRDTNGDPNTGKGSYIDFLAVIHDPVSGNDQDVEIKYDCGQQSPTNTSYHACKRFSCASTSYDTPCTLPTSSTDVVIDRVENASGNVFTFRDKTGAYAANAQDVWTVEANVQVPSRGSLYYGLTHPVTLDNQTSIPNLQNGS